MDRLQAAMGPKVAAVAADKLWQFQLRKENKALLEQLQENERRRQLDASEAERKLKDSADRIIALEARLSGVEREKFRDDQARKEFMKADAAFKADFKNFLEGRLSEVELLNILGGPSATASAAAPSSSRLGPPGNMPSSRSATSHQLNPVTILPCPRDQRITETNNMLNNQIQKTPRTCSKPTLARRPVTRSRNRSTDSPVETRAEVPSRTEAFKIPRITQGTNHIKTYYDNANEVFKGLDMNDAQLEVDFVSAFISGITDPKISNRLVSELQRAHPSRTKKDGRIEVLCDWDDVTEGLRKAGLLSPRKETSRRKHRFLGDLSDLGF